MAGLACVFNSAAGVNRGRRQSELFTPAGTCYTASLGDNDLKPEPLPASGPLGLGQIYRRADLHSRFGGSRYAGIVPSTREPVVLLFHTEEPLQQFYRDGFDREGVYWYSAEGATGDMRWTSANRAVRDHARSGSDLLLFERVQRKDGLWRFANNLHYRTHKMEQRPDKSGQMRSAIIFGLRPSAVSITGLIEVSSVVLNLPPLDEVSIAEAPGPLLRTQNPSSNSNLSRSGRRSRDAGPIGRRAEEIAHLFLERNAATLQARNIRWIAKENLTPGWDMQYENEIGELIAVEVKGTTESIFASIELTAGEWKAATALGDRYWLFLVAGCCGTHPRIQRIQNPACLVQRGTALVEPTQYRFSLQD